MEIPDPPSQRACGACSEPMRWYYDPHRQTWVAFIPGPDTWSITVHRCRPRTIRPPTPEYLAAREALGKTQDPNRIEGES